MAPPKDIRGLLGPFLLLLLLLPQGPSLTIPKELLQPPELMEEPPERVVVFPSDDVVLKCEATGNPPVTFRWTRDGQLFEPGQEPGTSLVPDTGTLLINGTQAPRYQGVFRCLADNRLGTALSRQARLIAESTPQWPKEKVTPVEVEEGASVVLPCDPPPSAVLPRIYWLNSRIMHIAQDARVNMGQDGYLYFAHAVPSDSHPDYICHAHFLSPRTIIQKEPITLRVTPSNALKHRPPQLLVPRGESSAYVALQGGTLLLECIPEGFPTPTVEWLRLNGPLPAERVSLENFQRTLQIQAVAEEDDGEYQCVARNSQGSTRHTFSVTVEAAPYWVRRPQSGIYAPGENVRLVCDVYGKPKPQVTWRMNGIPLEEVDADLRRTVRGGTLILAQVEPNDTQVMQCEAGNRHGRLLANAYVHVLELPAQILTTDGLQYSVVENSSAWLHCHPFGAPAPALTWLTEAQAPALGLDRAFIFTNGTLWLSSAQLSDTGTYTCHAHNTHGNTSITAHLAVKVATRVELTPRSATVKKGETVTFVCRAWADPSLSPATLSWDRDGQPLRETPDSDRLVLEPQGAGTGVLTVAGADYWDQGRLRCQAHTELDVVEAEAMLRVVGRPGPVSELQVSELEAGRWVTLSWTPGDEHNSPVEKFVVELEEQMFSPGQWREAAVVPPVPPQTRLALSPHGRYRLRVLGANAYGRGDPGTPSTPITTPPAAPDRFPAGLHGEGNQTDNMIITWEPLPPEDWNAPELSYRVQWRPAGDGGLWAEAMVTAPPVVVTPTPTFTPYDLRLQALNPAGKGPETPPTLGYSGEDVPLAYPENVGIELINSTSVLVSWILSSHEGLRGHLHGYWVQYWREGTAVNQGHRETSPRASEQELEAREKLEMRVLGRATQAVLGGLRPWSHYVVAVAVLNGRGAGPFSEEMHFNTPEGVPGPPTWLRLQRVSDSELALSWAPPRHPNGLLTAYELHYRPVSSPANASAPVAVSFLPEQLNVTLQLPAPQAHFRFALRACTRAGPGEPVVRLGSTAPEPVLPNLDNVSVVQVGNDFSVLSWTPSGAQRNVEFEVQFQAKTTAETWQEHWEVSGRANSTHGSYHLRNLQPGTAYWVQFVGRNHSGEHVPFWRGDIHTNGTAVILVQSVTSQGWFIGFVSAIVLLLLVLLGLCLVKRSKGGKYSVKDKEDTQGDSEARPMKDETFGEYRSLESDGEAEEKGLGSSGASLSGAGPALGSDDSLADYGGSGDVHFAEDGSFIGQYSGQAPHEAPAPDGSSGPPSPGRPPPGLE
ncbi:neuronal cell adhesion molecule isoform C [Alligator mississippiensis]|uniref:Neural cell adhesion molecule L1 n=1 Tax=Alligator mississippiensis TaxID=8496 RepID=A0A151NE14_ALLMI|nr:neuronal cell adhesion molecule isoform C [Alligator mississippiensis]